MTQTIVVTGASAGVGRAVARTFGARGDRVVLLARGRAGLEAAAKEVEAAGGEALVVPTDVADAEAVEAAAQAAEARFGPLDVWVNNAMTTVFAPFDQIRPEEFQRATEVTYLGVVWGTMAALKRMKPRDAGVIVNVGSSLAYRAIPLQSAYCGAKFAERGFTDAVRCELMHDASAVRITSVHLPAIDTPQFSWCRSKLPNHPMPVEPIYTPEVAAREIVAASDGRRREVVVGAMNVLIVQGNKVAPGVLDHYIAATGYEGQQTGDPVGPDRPSDLFGPVDDDHDVGERGVFGAKARGIDARFLATKGPRMALDLGKALAASVRARRAR